MAFTELAGRGADPAPGAGRLMAGSEESPELTSSLALRLPAKPEARREGAEPPQDVVPLIPACTVCLFFIYPAASILRSSLKMAGDISADERALR
jgi:hypothetical protein